MTKGDRDCLRKARWLGLIPGRDIDKEDPRIAAIRLEDEFERMGYIRDTFGYRKLRPEEISNADTGDTIFPVGSGKDTLDDIRSRMDKESRS